jgi:hypothetical protein
MVFSSEFGSHRDWERADALLSMIVSWKNGNAMSDEKLHAGSGSNRHLLFKSDGGEMGRFFDEKIYKQELAHRLPDVHLEVPIDVAFESFQKRYWLDLLVGDGSPCCATPVQGFRLRFTRRRSRISLAARSRWKRVLRSRLMAMWLASSACG